MLIVTTETIAGHEVIEALGQVFGASGIDIDPKPMRVSGGPRVSGSWILPAVGQYRLRRMWTPGNAGM